MKNTPVTPIEVLPAEKAVAAPISARLRKQLDAAPVRVQGTWEAARRWLEHAKYLQEAVLYCQVMLGFELIALREAVGETRGRPPSSGNKSTPWTFSDQAESETGLSRASVFKFISMAEAASTRLKKLPALKNWDPTSSIAALPPAQKEALSTAVRKMTDGLTQADFLVELGLAKAPQGSGATGGARERKAGSEPLPAEEQAEIERTFGRDDFSAAMRRLVTSGARFCLLPDAEVTEQIGWLEHQIKARRMWLAKPQGQRNAEEIEKFIQG